MAGQRKASEGKAAPVKGKAAPAARTGAAARKAAKPSAKAAKPPAKAAPKRRAAKQPRQSAKTAAEPLQRFRILVCIDGTEDAFRALRYAARIGAGTDADMTLLFVRPVDQGLQTGGLQISVARANLLDWGLELPGMRELRRARDMLVDIGYLSSNWAEEFRHVDVQGDPLGDNMVVCTSDEGRHIILKLMVSPSVGRGILDECDIGEYDIVIVAYSKDADGGGPGYIEPRVAETVAIEHRGTVLVARAIEESHGHLVCVWDNEQSIAAARRDAEIAGRCACPVHLYAVARDESELEAANRAVERARKAIEEVGVRVSSAKVEIGDPVEKIIEEGRGYSVIVMSSTARRGLRRFFTVGTSYQVLVKAHNSVMIAR